MNRTMSYHKKKNLRVVIDSDQNKYKTQDLQQNVLDLSESRFSAKLDDQSRGSPDLLIDGNTNDFSEEVSKNGDKVNTEKNKPGKRNPKCARCANHDPNPVSVKGHKRKCRYRECECRLCMLTVERRELMAKTIREKRKQKEDLADHTYRYLEPVFNNKRICSDKSSSETDRDSGYTTEEGDKSKTNVFEFSDELKKNVSIIWGDLIDSKISPAIIGQTILALNLSGQSLTKKSNMNPKSVTNLIIKASKQLSICEPLMNFMPSMPMSSISSLPLTPLTPTTPSTILSPPSSASSSGSADSPNESFNTDQSVLARSMGNRGFFPPSYYYHPAIMQSLNAKSYMPSFAFHPPGLVRP